MSQDDQTFWVWCGSIIVATLLGVAIPPHDFFTSFVGASVGASIGTVFRYFIGRK